MNRADLRRRFIDRNGWGAAAAIALAGDASGRRYERLAMPGDGTAVLMDAPPEAGEDIRPFLAIANHLGSLGLSPPRPIAADPDDGFLLLEDLGDALFARLVETDPEREAMLYAAATDLLLELHRHPAPKGLPRFGFAEMAAAIDVVFDWYLPHAPDGGTPAGRQALETLLLQALQAIPPHREVLALRDFHAENLIWMPERTGPARVGLLDFQDAFAGHPAYDLVSLLEDARRDVGHDLRDMAIERYLSGSGEDPDGFRYALAALGAQRNLRILGVFARLAMRAGKARYLDLMPRVWRHLEGDLTHPALAELGALVFEILPPPTPGQLERIRTG